MHPVCIGVKLREKAGPAISCYISRHPPLHAVGSGFNMILLALHTLNRDGWLVIEDIPPSQLRWFTLIDRILHDTLGANVSTSMAMPGKCCHVYILRRTS